MSNSIDNPSRLLTDFGSGEFMRLLNEDLKNYANREDEHNKKIHIIVSVSTDDTTVGSGRKINEKPLYLAIMNAKNAAYKLIFLGYGPVRMPYTDEILEQMLISRGFETKSGRKTILKNLKSSALQQFIHASFNKLTKFGQNLFRLQVGSGEKSKCSIQYVL